MTIEKGQNWGSEGFVEALRTSRSDKHLSQVVAEGTGDVQVQGGDTWIALGRPSAVQPPCRSLQLPFDAVEVVVEVERWVAFSSVVIRQPWTRGGWLRGDVWVVSATGIYRGRNLTPRAHPNDGLLDVIHCDPAMSVRQRLTAWKRARIGDHLPHRHLVVRRVERADVSSTRRLDVWVDGRRVGSARCVHLGVLVDHWTLSLPSASSPREPSQEHLESDVEERGGM